MSEYSKLSKDELEALGRKYDIELDRRILKSKMVKQLENHISSLTKDELEKIAREEGVELDKRLKIWFRGRTNYHNRCYWGTSIR